MKYLSFDLEATGLEEDAYIIEFGMVPFDTETSVIEMDLSKQFYVHCPPFDELKENLNPWVVEHNKELIIKANQKGITKEDFKLLMQNYLASAKVQEYFGGKQVTLFGKSISAIDLPFLNRDLGWEWMNENFHHRTQDLSCFTSGLIDMGYLEEGLSSGAKLMESLGMGDVCHTALEDAVNTAKMYLKLLERFHKKS